MCDSPNIFPASFSRRLGAMLYDAFLVVAIWFISAAIVVAINQFEVAYGAWFQSLLFIEACLFFIFFWSSSSGATLGMKAWNLRVQTLSGHPISLRQGAIRCIVSLPAILVFGLGYLWILIDPLKRSWGDYLSKTHVVFIPKEWRPQKTASNMQV